LTAFLETKHLCTSPRHTPVVVSLFPLYQFESPVLVSLGLQFATLKHLFCYSGTNLKCVQNPCYFQSTLVQLSI